LRGTDRILSWFLRKAIIPRTIRLDIPGFIVERVESENNIRNMLLPEALIGNIERRIVDKAGQEGAQRLYSVGKRFGYRHALISRLPVWEGQSAFQKRKFLSAAHFVIKYIGSVYSSDIREVIDLEAKKLTIRANNFVVCRHNGLGLLLTSGGVAGIWACAMNDHTVEGVQTACQGRGDAHCEVVCAPSAELKREGHKVYHERRVTHLALDERYRDFNRPRKLEYAETSAQDMINLGVFRYEGGVLSLGDERHFVCGASLVYMLEEEFASDREVGRVLRETAYEQGRRIGTAAGRRDYRRFVPEYLASCGWGDTLVSESARLKLRVNFFPWTKWTDDATFTIFKGLVEGMLSELRQKRTKFRAVYGDTKAGWLTLQTS